MGPPEKGTRILMIDPWTVKVIRQLIHTHRYITIYSPEGPTISNHVDITAVASARRSVAHFITKGYYQVLLLCHISIFQRLF